MPGAIVSTTQGKIDIALSQFARMYSNNSFVAERLFPRVEVNHQSDKFWLYGRENQALRENTKRAPGSPAERIAQTLSNTNYNCVDHSLARLIPDEERANFQAGTGGSVEQWATKAISDKLFLDEEIAAAALATDTTKYAGANSVTLAGQSQWSDLANSTPISDVETGKSTIRQIGQEANVMVISDPVYKILRVHPAILQRLVYTKGGQITLQDLAAVFGIEQVLLASAVQLDVADTPTFVWGKHVVLAYAQQNPTPMDVSLGKTFVWTDAPGTVGGFQVEIGRLSPPSAKSDEVAEHFYYDQRVTSNVSGYLIKNAVN
jgi:hypothetical protein